MVIDAASVASLQRGLNMSFQGALSSVMPTWETVAMKTMSTGKGEDYPWMGFVPTLTEWIGERQVKDIAAYKWNIENKDYEASFSVKRNDILDDKIGIYAPMAAMLATRAAAHPDSLVYDLFNNGGAALCYDGQFFFDTDHPRKSDGASQVNIFTSTALTLDNYFTVRAAMRAITDDRGEPMGIKPNLLVVPAELEQEGLEIVTSNLNPTGEDNVALKTNIDLLVSERLTGATTWFLLDTSQPVRPLIFQERQAPVFTSMTDPASPDVWNRKEYKFGVDYRGAADYGLWQFAAQSTA